MDMAASSADEDSAVAVASASFAAGMGPAGEAREAGPAAGSLGGHSASAERLTDDSCRTQAWARATSPTSAGPHAELTCSPRARGEKGFGTYGGPAGEAMPAGAPASGTPEGSSPAGTAMPAKGPAGEAGPAPPR